MELQIILGIGFLTLTVVAQWWSFGTDTVLDENVGAELY
jgi:hypothetical protein